MEGIPQWHDVMAQLHAASHITRPILFSDFIIAPPTSLAHDYLTRMRVATPSIACWKFNFSIDVVTYSHPVDQYGYVQWLSCNADHQWTLEAHHKKIPIFDEPASQLRGFQRVRLGYWDTSGPPHASTVVFPVITGSHMGLLCVGEQGFNRYVGTLYSYEGHRKLRVKSATRGDTLLANSPMANRVAYWDEYIVGIAFYVNSYIEVHEMMQSCQKAAVDGKFTRCTDLPAYFLDLVDGTSEKWNGKQRRHYQAYLELLVLRSGSHSMGTRRRRWWPSQAAQT